MDMGIIVVILLFAFVSLLVLGHRGLSEGIGSEAAFGGVALALATVLGCLLMVMLYGETA